MSKNQTAKIKPMFGCLNINFNEISSLLPRQKHVPLHTLSCHQVFLMQSHLYVYLSKKVHKNNKYILTCSNQIEVFILCGNDTALSVKFFFPQTIGYFDWFFLGVKTHTSITILFSYSV